MFIRYGINISYLLYYKRSYEKLTSVVLDISEIARVFFVIGGYIISFLSQNYFSYKLFDEIFPQKYPSTN